MIQLSFRVLLAFGLSLFLAACGPGDPEPDQGPAADMGVDAPDTPPDTPDMAEPDAPSDDVGPPDMPPVDTDGDGVFDPDDNCPDVANEEQLDRDRDGLGDDCDSLPFIHDPSDPATVLTVMENEDLLPNDNEIDGLAYDLELPFVARGVVGPEDNAGDFDFYSFEIDAPTHIIVRLTASMNIWPGAVVLGIDLPNQNVFRAALSPDIGVSTDREMFLPYPGRYTILMTDARNLIASQPDVGGAGLQYAVSVSALPLPEPELVSLPSPAITADQDGVTRVYEVDVAGLEGVRFTSTGVPLDQNSFVLPALALYDPDADQGLAMTSVNQSAETQTATLGIKLGDRQRIWVIDDHTQAFGATSTRVDFEIADMTSEPETLAAPADTRDSDLPWLEVGESMKATIGQPRAAGPTSLVGDEDFFLFSARRGQTLRLTVTPDAGSLLETFVEFAHFPDQLGFPIVIHESQQRAVGEAAIVEYVITAYVEGEIAAYVQHGPNQFSANPVGGPSYGYTVTVEEIQPQVTPINAVPGSAAVEFEPGRVGLVSFDAAVGQILTVSEDSTLFSDMRVIDTTTWRPVADGGSALTFGPQNEGQYWVELRDIIGRGTDGTPATISVAPVAPTPLGALPATVSGVLDTQPRHLYSFSATAGDILDIRLVTPNFFGAIDLFDSTFQPASGRAYEDQQFVVPADGEYIIGISSSGGTTRDDYDYELGVQLIAATPSTLPIRETAVFDNQPFARWLQLPVVDGTTYAGYITSPEAAFSEKITVFDEDLNFLRTSVLGALRWTADFTGNVWLAIEDSSNVGGPTYDYSLAFAEITTQSIAVALPTAGQLGSGADEVIHTFSLAAGAMIEFDVDATGDWRPLVRLVTAPDFGSLTEPTSVGGTIRYALSTPGDYGVAVRSTDPAATGPLNYTATLNLVAASGAVPETEPNDTPVEAQDPGAPPVAVAATLTGPESDRFRLPLIRGQRIWALTTDRNGFGTNRYDARLYLHDEGDNVIETDLYSGEGFMPAIYAYDVPSSGEYQVVYGARAGGAADGDYTLYIATGPAQDIAEMEPNNDTTAAQTIASFSGPTRISASVDGVDTSDVFAVTIAASGARVAVSLENAGIGHELRLLDATGALVVASGQGSDGLDNPAIDQTGLAAGTYFVELAAGNGTGTADLIVIIE